jgi:hypothetical protein
VNSRIQLREFTWVVYFARLRRALVGDFLVALPSFKASSTLVMVIRQ